MGCPSSTAERAAKRKEIRSYHLVKAERAALASGRSMKCSGYGGYYSPRHSGDPDGCRNDGSGCLCECHDE